MRSRTGRSRKVVHLRSGRRRGWSWRATGRCEREGKVGSFASGLLVLAVALFGLGFDECLMQSRVILSHGLYRHGFRGVKGMPHCCAGRGLECDQPDSSVPPLANWPSPPPASAPPLPSPARSPSPLLTGEFLGLKPRLRDSSRRDRLLTVREVGHSRSRSSEGAAGLFGATRRQTISQRRTTSRRCVQWSRTRKPGRSDVEVGAVPESPHMSESSSSAREELSGAAGSYSLEKDSNSCSIPRAAHASDAYRTRTPCEKATKTAMKQSRRSWSPTRTLTIRVRSQHAEPLSAPTSHWTVPSC